MDNIPANIGDQLGSLHATGLKPAAIRDNDERGHISEIAAGNVPAR
jgi:hypothetical protein